MSDAEYLASVVLPKLVGKKITGVVVTPDKEYSGFQLSNGVGWLDIEGAKSPSPH